MRLNIPGSDLPSIFTLRNIPDADRIRDHIDKKKPKDAVIIGGGYIGLEMAENLSRLGMMVSIVEALPQLMANFDPDMAVLIQDELKLSGVNVLTGESVLGFADKNGKTAVKLASGKELNADIVVLSIGVTPDTALAAEAGLELGVKKGIAVNGYMQTSDPDIYAVGDAVLVKHRVTGWMLSYRLLDRPINRAGSRPITWFSGIKKHIKVRSVRA